MIVVSFGLITLEQIQHLPSDSSLISESPHNGINLAQKLLLLSFAYTRPADGCVSWILGFRRETGRC